MGTQIITDDDSIKVIINGFDVAQFEDGGNGMEGDIFEGDNSRMSASDLIAVARFLLSKAEERAQNAEDRP